jgi:hypothetical protein
MYIRSKASKKAHKDNCRYCQKIFEENKKQYECTDDAIDDGCVFCQYCSPIVERLNKKKAHIEEAAHKLKLKYKLKNGILMVDDGLSKWNLYYSTRKRKILLYHQNHSVKDSEKETSPVTGYHRQKVLPTSIEATFEYISDHFQNYLTSSKLPENVQNRAKDIFYEKKRKYKRNDKSRKKEKHNEKRKAIWNVLTLIEGLQHTG